jgi:uncharacterized membrane protein YbhN (UPF0104 family)
MKMENQNAIQPSKDQKKNWFHKLFPLFSIGLMIGAFFILKNEFQKLEWSEVVLQLKLIQLKQWQMAALFTVGSFLVFGSYEFLATRYMGFKLPFKKPLLVAFIAYSISHGIGLSVITSGSVRYRLYSQWGLNAFQVGTLILFCMLGFGLGFLILTGASLIFSPLHLPMLSSVPDWIYPTVGSIFWAAIAGAISLSILGILDWITISGAFYWLLIPHGVVSYPYFLSVYLIAQIAGLISNVPGGLGIFESIIILFLTPQIPDAAVFGSIIAFRIVYYFAPLALGALTLAIYELQQKFLRSKHRPTA